MSARSCNSLCQEEAIFRIRWSMVMTLEYLCACINVRCQFYVLLLVYCQIYMHV